MVLNLVVNALDSMDEGGTLTIRLRQRDGMAEMDFTDTGCGMTQEVLENIFEPFFTRSRTGKGTGLGLTISHRIISQHGGEIEATSAGPEPGQHLHRPAAAAAGRSGRSAGDGGVRPQPRPEAEFAARQAERKTFERRCGTTRRARTVAMTDSTLHPDRRPRSGLDTA